MQVKLEGLLSSRKEIWGGSPQGCVTANALFCATIELLQDGDMEQDPSAHNYARLYEPDPEMTLFASDTILENEITDDEDGSPPFEQNRWAIEDVPFTPDNISPPRNGYRAIKEDSILSTIQNKIATEYSPVICRPTAARARKTRIFYCLLYTSPSPRDRQKSRMPSSA